MNQWLISLFGIDPLAENKLRGEEVRPFHILADPIRDPRMEGLDSDNLHHFYHYLGNSPLFSVGRPNADLPGFRIDRNLLLRYERNIVRHTQAINEKRLLPIVWKYFQWLTLLFVEIYLDRYFNNRESLLSELNGYVEKFNRHWPDKEPVPFYTEDELNKLCMQNATGSGKTLLMHVNLLQYRHYAKEKGRDKELSRVILLTPNERLSEQHIAEFRQSDISSSNFAKEGHSLFTQARGLERVDVLEITKLADQEGPNTLAARSLGDQNLLLVDEGHRGMSGKEEGVWFSRRSSLCARGFTFEYSATFEQAVKASGNAAFENSYAKSVIFDYSYRWFYEDGFGKDYKIDNLPHPDQETIIRLIEKGNIKKASILDHDRDVANAMMPYFLTAALLKFYQQLRIFEENSPNLKIYNIEKPLWVFVGSTVVKKSGSKEVEAPGTEMLSDIGMIIHFFADFLDNRQAYAARINEILTGKGEDTGLLDKDGNDIFAGSFTYLAKAMLGGENTEVIYRDILSKLFNNNAGGNLVLDRIKGESGEIALRVGTSEIPFGLINVGDAKGLCDHLSKEAKSNKINLTIEESEFTEAMFASVKDSSSPVNLLIGSKKFVEGWDCWRVSTMGLMHVGRSEGTQIIQLFGRGVRLKGFEWSLMRTQNNRYQGPIPPDYIHELELLNVFGIEADFMERFREYLKEEGFPGNEQRKIFTVPLNVIDFGNKLKILRPKRKKSDGKDYQFNKDGPVPLLGDIPDYIVHNAVLVDWYPQIQSEQSQGTRLNTEKTTVSFFDSQLALLDYDALFFEMEQFKRERGWYNFNMSKQSIYHLFKNTTWYRLYLPESRMNPINYEGIMLLQQVAVELLKRYCEHYYKYRADEYIKPRLEYRALTREDDNFPQEENYQLTVNENDTDVILDIQRLIKDLNEQKNDIIESRYLLACNFNRHLYSPLFQVRKNGKISIMPVSLNESEYLFVKDLKEWCKNNEQRLKKDKMELYLLRNLSRGKGVGFFEAGNFHPDFILWILADGKQYINFVEPHGLLIGSGPADEKVQFHIQIKEIEKRLNVPQIILNSFILSGTPYPQLNWGNSRSELEEKHVLFMTDDKEQYINKLFKKSLSP